MKPDKVDRFLAKRKEREAQHAAAEDAQLLLGIQHPNRCPESPGTPAENMNSVAGDIKYQQENPETNQCGEQNKDHINQNKCPQIKNRISTIECKDELQEQEFIKAMDHEKSKLSSNLTGSLKKYEEIEIRNNWLDIQRNKTTSHFQNEPTIAASSMSYTNRLREPQDMGWNVMTQMQPCSTVTSSHISHTRDSYGYMTHSSNLQGGFLGREWLPRPTNIDQACPGAYNYQGNRTSVIALNYHDNNRHYVNTVLKHEPKIEEISDISRSNNDQHCPTAVTEVRQACNSQFFASRISVLKRKQMDMEEVSQVENYQPYRSVIQKNNQNNNDTLVPRHGVADYKYSVLPRPCGSLKGILLQTIDKKEADTKDTSEDSDKSIVKVGNILIDNQNTVVTINEDKSEDKEAHSSSLFPLKKRQRMMEIPYSTSHGINKKVIPVISFTLEEEFRVMDYIVRIEQYQNRRFQYLSTNFPHYKEMTLGYVGCTLKGKKIPFNRVLENKLFSTGLEFTKQTSTEIFDEIGALNKVTRTDLIARTYPALYVVMWAILEGNTKEKTWMDQHMVRVTAKQVTINNGPVVLHDKSGRPLFVHEYVLN